jgi:hypothetical protein
MVAMLVNGQKIGTLEDLIRAIRGAAENNQSVEFREPDGRMIGAFDPAEDELPAPWDPSITWEQLEQMRSGEFLTWEEAKKRMGWE